MAKKAEEWEVAAYRLADAIRRKIPEQYQKDPDPKDWLARVWKDSLKAAIHTWTMLEDLGTLLREKAGINDDGPTADCRLGHNDQPKMILSDEPEDPASDGETAER